MTGPERQQALLECIAAALALQKADKVLKQCGRSVPTVLRVLHGRDHRISTLVDIADALDCDVEIRILPRHSQI